MSENFKNVNERIAAYVIDHFLIFLCWVTALAFFVVILFFIPETHDETLMETLIATFRILSLFPITILYFTLFEFWKATTPGKKLFNLEVFNKPKEEGKSLTLKQVFIRNLSKLRIELLILDLFVGFIVSLREKQRLLEKLSDTYVMDVPAPQLNVQARKTKRVFKIVLTIIGTFFLAIMIIGYIFQYFDFLQSFNLLS